MTFVLIHGAWHGGWCWELVAQGLRNLGHDVLTPDLPAHGCRAEEIADQTLESYVGCVAELLEQQPAPVILVGHSMGGTVITEAAEKCPEKVEKLVYLAAFLLKNGQSISSKETGIRPLDLYSRSSDGKTVPFTERQILGFSKDCSESVRETLYPRLCSEAIAPMETGVRYTQERWGTIRRYYIACEDDVAATPEAVKEMLQNNPCEKTYMIKADHLAFYSAPDEVVQLLDSIAKLPQ